jgi:hypothetical protein
MNGSGGLGGLEGTRQTHTAGAVSDEIWSPACNREELEALRGVH